MLIQGTQVLWGLIILVSIATRVWLTVCAPPLPVQSSAPYWICVQAEEAEKSSGVAHSTPSFSMAAWWKKSLLQTNQTAYVAQR